MSRPDPGPRVSWMYRSIALTVGVLWLVILPMRPLFNPDEGRYAEIPREMLAGGDWVIPHLNGLIYIEKPPLQYWATALALRVFGEGEFAVRIYTALCAFGTLWAVWLAAHRLWGAAAAWRSAAALTGMLLFVVLGQLLTLDMSLTFYMTLSLTAFLAAQQPAERAAARRLMLLAWAATALGVLTKGLVAAAIPAAVLVLYSVCRRELRPWRRLHVAWGLPLLLAIAVPWHWLAERRLPGFLQFFFVHEHLARYLTPSADREEAWWFFGAVFLAGTLPWTPTALRVLATGWRRRAGSGPFDAGLFLWIWVMFIGVFFSISDSKLIPYILPALPAVALLIGALAPGRLQRDLTIIAGLTGVVAATLAGAALYGPRFLDRTDRGHVFAQLAAPLGVVAVVLAVTACGVLITRRRGATHGAVMLGTGWCIAGLLVMRAAAAVAPIYSGVDLARAIPAMPSGVPLFSVATYDQTLPFYWRRTVELVAYRGELDYGLGRDPSAEIADLGCFIDRWRAVPYGYAVMEKNMFERLQNARVPMRVLARDVRRVLVARQ